jgi:integrase
MPLKLVYGRKKTKAGNIYIRGTYLGVKVDESCRTDRGAVARARLKALERSIELGEHPPKEARIDREQRPTFLSAAVAYMESGRPRRYIAPLIKYFGETPIDDIDQASIDAAAAAICPNATPMTKTAYVYTPVSAIIHTAGSKLIVKRPKGWQGRTVSDWLTSDDAFGIIEAADSFDPEFGTLLAFLLYTGPRIGAALNLMREDVRLEEGRAWARPQKGQPHMDVRLRKDLCERLGALLASHDRRRVFRWAYGAHLAHQLTRSKLIYLGLPVPRRRPIGWRESPNRLEWVTFHIWRHTWATWMRQAGTDLKGLVATGNWRSERSANRYAHAVARDEWDRVEKLPGMGKKAGKRVAPA